MPTFRQRDTKRARALRNSASPAERILWRHLGARRLAGHKFSRQMPVGPYFADFLCRERMLIVEIDGHSHDFQIDHDARRDAFLRQEGYRVLRFANADVTERLEGVLFVIDEVLASSEAAHPRPLPQAGGEE